VGAYYQDAKLRSASDTKLNDGQYNAAANRYSAFETYAKQDGKTISAFGQLMWNITPQVELAGGARWTKEKKNFDKFNAYGIGTFNTAATVYPGSSQVGHLQGRFRDSNVSPEVTLRWSPDSNHTLFAAYRTGFKSGGFGLTNPTQVSTRIASVDFDSEKAKGFEVGGRLIGLNGRLNLSGAAFAYDFTNLQVNTYNPALIAYTINNAGKVRQRGFEAEVNFRATPALTVHGAIAYVRNRFSDFVGQCYARLPDRQHAVNCDAPGQLLVPQHDNAHLAAGL
jgi:outer membrane receptor protein involved in Fe transport